MIGIELSDHRRYLAFQKLCNDCNKSVRSFMRSIASAFSQRFEIENHQSNSAVNGDHDH